MIQWLIDTSLRNRFLVIAGFLLLGGWGYWALRTVPIDAIPDLSDNQVIVFTDWPGRSPQEVEDQITYPLTVGLQGLPGVRVVRSSSAFGFSMINVIFEDMRWISTSRARGSWNGSICSNKALPAGVVPTLGPGRHGGGARLLVYRGGAGHMPSATCGRFRTGLSAISSTPCRAWPRWRASGERSGSIRSTWTPIGCGPSASRSRPSWTPSCGATATSAAMSSRPAAPGRSSVASGLIEDVSDIEQIVIGAANGVPIFLRQVAEVKIGDAFRASALVKGTEEAVGGVVVARYGVSTIDVIDRVKAKFKRSRPGCRPACGSCPSTTARSSSAGRWRPSSRR